jgi:hypothetical protein
MTDKLRMLLLAAAVTALPSTAAFAAPKPVLAHVDSANPAADTMFAEPFVDIDEWRETPQRHRYIHGGFKGTETKFSFYLPPKEKFQGRFFQYVTPVPDGENLAQTIQNGDDKIGFSIASGAYFVETNGGGVSNTGGPAFGADPKIGAFRANAAAARFSRKLAMEMYGSKRVYGYIFGGSGGGYRTLGSMENTEGVWDGAVPFVLGSPMAAPNVFAVRMHAMRILKDKFPQIVDAMDAGGSGDPYAGLNEEEAAALREVTKMGFPIKSWFGHEKMGVHAFTALYRGMVIADPGYFTDFWTKPGYLGFDPPESLKKARLQFTTKVKAPLSAEQLEARGLIDKRLPGQPKGDPRGTVDQAWAAVLNDGSARPMAFELADTPPDIGFIGGDLYIESGAAKGKRLALRALNGNVANLGIIDLKTLAMVKPGDEVRVDNSNFLAAQTYHRHQVPGPEYKVWDQFRGADGKPIGPQRKINLGPMFAMGAAGTVPTGKFNGKIIIVGAMLDREAFAWQSDYYSQRIEEHYGKDAVNKYRIWYTDNALHGYNEWVDAPTRVVSYLPVLQQALRDVSAWVERGVKPADNSSYKIDDGQTILATTAAERKSVQPVVTLTVNGGDLAKVKTGETVKLVATVEAPPGNSFVQGISWSFNGEVPKAAPSKNSGNRKSSIFETQTSFATPGTYFVAAKGSAQRKGAIGTPYALVENLARVRVIVE